MDGLGPVLLQRGLGVVAALRPDDIPATPFAQPAGDLLAVTHAGGVHIAGQDDFLQFLKPRIAAQRGVAVIDVGGRVIAL